MNNFKDQLKDFGDNFLDGLLIGLNVLFVFACFLVTIILTAFLVLKGFPIIAVLAFCCFFGFYNAIQKYRENKKFNKI